MRSYTKPKDNLSSKSSERLNLYQRYEAAPKHRPPFALKYIWDGSTSTFDRYCKLIEGFLMMVGAGYLIHPTFLKRYREMGGEYFTSEEFWQSHKVTVPQAKYDRQYLYGILVTSNRDKEHTKEP